MKKIVLLVAAMVILPTAGAFASEKTLSKIQPSVPACDPETVVGVFVELCRPSVVFAQTFDGKAQISSRELMRPGNTSTGFQLASILNGQLKHIETVKNIVADAKIGSTYQYAFNGYFIETRRKNLENIAALPEVLSIFALKPQTIQRTRTRALIGAEKVWQTVKDPKGREVDGKGVLISITDTGLDYTHPDFGSQKKPVGSKVVVSRDLAMKDNDCQEEKMELHGTACASIAAGDGPDNPVTGVKEKGIAPKALLAGYKGAAIINGEEQFTQEAAMASWDWLIVDKIDVSSNSWGIPTGEHEFEKQELACALVGCTVVCANGNYGTQGDGYFPLPQSSSGAGNSAIGVGATDDLDVSYLTVGSQKDSIQLTGMWGSTGKTFEKYETSLTVADCLWGRAGDFPDVKGKVALIERGPFDPKFGEPVTFADKIERAYDNGASAIILTNIDSSFIYGSYAEDGSQKMLPIYELGNFQGDAVRRRLHDMSSWKPGELDLNQKDVRVEFSKPKVKGTIAYFSSNGPTKLGYLKPDVCAAGIGVHAAASKHFWDIYKGYYFETMGGTSSATPFVAGCAALVKQARPGWNPFEIKRALMNTGTLLTKMDGSRFLPFVAQGQGRVNVYDATTTSILIQPPSALIVAGTKKINIADKPAELGDPAKQAGISKDVLNSDIPIKIYNYSDKEVTLNLSFEINSGKPSQFKVGFTSTEVVVPPSKNEPGFAWVGVNVKMPAVVWGSLNDIIIWMTDKVTNRRVHTGVCIYNGDPEKGRQKQGIIKDLRADNWRITPNGDGVEDDIEFSYDITGGLRDGDPYPIINNQGKMLVFWAADKTGGKWSAIHVEEEFEPGPGSFVWDGKDVDGKMILPDGEWFVGVTALSKSLNAEQSAFVDGTSEYQTDCSFMVENSPAEPPTTVSASVDPFEPSVGNKLWICLNISKAVNVKSMSFKVKIEDAKEFMSYIGYDVVATADDIGAKPLVTVEYDSETGTFEVGWQKPIDGINGFRELLRLGFFAKKASFADVVLDDFVVTGVNDAGKEEKIKILSTDLEFSIEKTAFSPADFNRDGKVDNTDLDLITSLLGVQKSDKNYNPRCDMDRSGVIDTIDLAMFAKYLNQP